ncbi:Xaa-Pro dipeptidyl-peptidase [Solihabitans fulvus]|uniref:Xaa-Pro dipeptidyl-peptidase n=1 Tax=Solihabitans fulvus TaxID=1892852 RepID=A0A5B2WSC3_9PSEU|nr:Xaa-Pro dipeptidyl-peptidase [Solihabitans fulvus]KAA2254883.1 Xaa-Pro dipeptidyl-peptidase [Solihabitans fulvus]
MRGVRKIALLVSLIALPLTVVPAFADTPTGPVFVDGEAQPVFDPADVVRQDLWVRAPVDSDGDGRPDEVHVQVVRPRITERGLKVPAVYQISPYYAGGNDVVDHDVDVELYQPPGPRSGRVLHATTDERIAAAVGPRPARAARISSRYQDYFVARGFAMVYAESLGSGQSTGCATSGGRNETIGARSVVDWLNGRATAHDAAGSPVTAGWATGKVGMMGVSYNGTLPNAVASTGVRGLEAIVPIAAISSWYDYYREGGAVVAPGEFQGEDTDVLADYVNTRADNQVCRAVIDKLAREQDRTTGDYNAFWDERNYVKDAGKVHAAVLAVHGLNDWNVKSMQVAQWYAALRANHVPHKIWLHQYAHTDPIALRPVEWLHTLNRWFSRYLYGVANGIEDAPKATIQREDKTWTDEADWPAPGAADTTLWPWPGGPAKGTLDPGAGVPGRATVEQLADDAGTTVEELVDLPSSGNRLSYATKPARVPLRLSGTPRAELGIAFDRPAANVTVVLADRAPDGTSRIVTRGWIDPQNRDDLAVSKPIHPDTQYRLAVDMQPKDYVLAVGHALEFVVLSSDHDYTLRPRPGTGLSVDLTTTSLVLPAVGGQDAVVNSVG